MREGIKKRNEETETLILERKLGFVFFAGAAARMQRSPYILRTSITCWQISSRSSCVSAFECVSRFVSWLSTNINRLNWNIRNDEETKERKAVLGEIYKTIVNSRSPILFFLLSCLFFRFSSFSETPRLRFKKLAQCANAACKLRRPRCSTTCCLSVYIYISAWLLGEKLRSAGSQLHPTLPARSFRTIFILHDQICSVSFLVSSKSEYCFLV